MNQHSSWMHGFDWSCINHESFLCSKGNLQSYELLIQGLRPPIALFSGESKRAVMYTLYHALRIIAPMLHSASAYLRGPHKYSVHVWLRGCSSPIAKSTQYTSLFYTLKMFQFTLKKYLSSILQLHLHGLGMHMWLFILTLCLFSPLEENSKRGLWLE